MKKSIFTILCMAAAIAGMMFTSCKPEQGHDGKYTISVVSDNDQMGKAYGSGEFDAGTVTRIWGTPEVGYQFDRWNDGNTENPRNITVNENATYTAYFKAIGSDPGTDTTGGGETPGEFVADFVFNGTSYQGIALVSMGPAQDLFNLSIYAGEGTNVLATFIKPQTGSQTLADGIQAFFYDSEDSFVETANGAVPPYLTVPSAGCTFDVTVSALDLTAQSVSLSASGTMLDIAAAEGGQGVNLVPFSFMMEGYFQYPGIPQGK